jgi:glc operon protein GlcG
MPTKEPFLFSINEEKEKKMFTREFLGLKEAKAAMEAILDEASKNPGQPVSIAIVDHQGEIVCAARMDGATPMFNYMALKKARSSATTGKNTRDWLEFLGKRNYTPQDFVPEATRIPGGVAVVKPGANGVVLGGIGVSGRTGNEDEALSMMGLKVLQKTVWG